MKQELSYLKEKFETNDTPRQEDFSDWMDSYWHKDEKIPVENLDTANYLLTTTTEIEAPDSTYYYTYLTSNDNVPRRMNLANYMSKNYFTQILSDNRYIKKIDLAGTGIRLVQANASGNLTAELTVEEEFESDVDLISAIKSATYTNSIASIAVTNKTFSKGKKYVDNSTGYLYMAFLDNSIIRK